MRHFTLALGESDFVISLDTACAAFLPAFFPTARPVTHPLGGSHLVRISRAASSFELAVETTGQDPSDPRRLTDPALALLALEEAVEGLVIAEANELLALHGGAVSTAAGSCLILGDSRSGKSSTTFQLTELGHPCLCEEISLCDPSSWRVRPYPQTLSLSEALLDEFAGAFAIQGRLHRPTPSIVRYEPPSRGAAPADPVANILLPEYREGAETRFYRTSSEEALTEVLGYCFPPNVETEAHFDRVIELLERVEIHRFRYSSAIAARSALAELFSA